mgnify:CR=1 FL=1
MMTNDLVAHSQSRSFCFDRRRTLIDRTQIFMLSHRRLARSQTTGTVSLPFPADNRTCEVLRRMSAVLKKRGSNFAQGRHSAATAVNVFPFITSS